MKYQYNKENLSPRGDLRLRLIAKARELLEADGCAPLTLRGVARAVGVSHMAPYRHFKDKDELLAAVAEEGFKELTRRLDNGVKTDQQGVAYVTFGIDNPALYRLMFGEQFTPAGRFPALDVASAEAFARCASIADNNVGDAGQKNTTPYGAWALWACVHGLASLIIDGRILLSADPKRREAEISEILQRSAPSCPSLADASRA